MYFDMMVIAPIKREREKQKDRERLSIQLVLCTLYSPKSNNNF